MKRFLSEFFLLSCTILSFGQNISLQIIQPDFLKVDAGRDTLILLGGTTIIGGNPSASNGYGNFLYNWEPADGLSDPSLSNPIAAPDQPTTYRLTVIDGGRCIGQDEVTVTVDAASITLEQRLPQITVYPNPAASELFVIIEGISMEAELHLTDALGNLMLMKRIRFENEWKGSLLIEGFAAGYYFLSVIGSDKRTVLPVIILK